MPDARGRDVIRVLVAHPGRLLREALAAVLSRERDIEVVSELAYEDDLLATALRERPDVALVKPSQPDSAAVDALCRVPPKICVLLLLNPHASAGPALSLVRLAPRVGMISTDASRADLVDAVRQMARGKPVLDTELAVAALHARESPLTDRESEVLRLAMTGATAQEVARTLSLSVGTVRNYLSNTLTKTGARTRIEAIRIARDSGWI